MRAGFIHFLTFLRWWSRSGIEEAMSESMESVSGREP